MLVWSANFETKIDAVDSLLNLWLENKERCTQLEKKCSEYEKKIEELQLELQIMALTHHS